MINKTMEEALNEQINAEYYSAYLYLSMAAYFESENLEGFANWMHIQYQEEISHSMKFFNFLTERGGKVELKAIEGPPTKWESTLHAFEDTLKHEQAVTDRINKLVDLSIGERDHATNNFLQWFVNEQVEEEASVSNVIGKIKMVQDSKDSLYLLDQELAQRTFVDNTKTNK